MMVMRIESVSLKLPLFCLVWLLLFGITVAARGRAPAYAATQSNARGDNHVTQKSRFACLPADVHSTDVVTYGKNAKANVTVERRLIEMKAQCRHGKLVDAKRREIKFFRPSCWGNPPSDYLEIQQRENAELQKLKRTYTVIVFGCDRTISRLPSGGLAPAGHPWAAQAPLAPHIAVSLGLTVTLLPSLEAPLPGAGGASLSEDSAR